MKVTQRVALAAYFRGASVDIATYIDSLSGQGYHHFTTQDAAGALGSSPAAVRTAIRRLRKKRRVATPLRGFHLIVPPEYRELECLPADRFVPELMAYLGLDYYAGLLTAASLYGAAHDAPMVFQTIVADNRPEIHCGRARVEFVARRKEASVIAEESYAFVTATPVISPIGGLYSSPRTVNIGTTTEDASTYYTMNGGEPTVLSILYTGPFLVNATSTIRARAFREGFDPGRRRRQSTPSAETWG